MLYMISQDIGQIDIIMLSYPLTITPSLSIHKSNIFYKSNWHMYHDESSPTTACLSILIGQIDCISDLSNIPLIIYFLLHYNYLLQNIVIPMSWSDQSIWHCSIIQYSSTKSNRQGTNPKWIHIKQKHTEINPTCRSKTT